MYVCINTERERELILLLHLPYLAFNFRLHNSIYLDSAYFQRQKRQREIETVYLKRSIIRHLLKMEDNSHIL